ncbi:hypothetical protein ACFO3D_12600 [Virgibacillus kekensis]|uniref:IDEAL domain-containing protein n=1 Tax=Virgibacillus kekensis TaxID=202261 RepID=A0ABV9DKX6_9BACI
MRLDGNIITGEFDQQTNEFTLKQIKHFTTESTIKESQLNALAEYLDQHKDEEDGQVLSLYDQLLVRLNQEEIDLFLKDLDKIKPLYH